jgi:hypothetical protein
LISVLYVNLPRHEFIADPQHGKAEQAVTDASGQKNERLPELVVFEVGYL